MVFFIIEKECLRCEGNNFQYKEEIILGVMGKKYFRLCGYKVVLAADIALVWMGI